MLMVVYIHAYNLNVYFTDQAEVGLLASSGLRFSWPAFIQEFLSDGIFRIAVPFFFIISGYFLFAKYEGRFSFNIYIEVLKKRIKTLVIPFIIISVLGLILVVLLQKIPGTGVFFNTYKIKYLTLKVIFLKLFILPVSYQLWFINYLFRCVVISPIIYLLIRYTGVFYIYILLILWIDYNLQYKLNLPQIMVETLLSFSIGSYLAIKQIPIPKVNSKWLAFLLTAIWVSIIVLRTSYKFQSWSFAEVHYWLKPGILFGILASWACYDVWLSKLANNKWLLSLASFNFGIYLFHEPALTIFKKLAIRFFGATEISLLFIYFITGLLAILFSYYFSKGLKWLSPNSYAVVTGGR